MKSCSLNDFMDELKPWLDQDHIRKVEMNDHGNFVVYFQDGMKNVYSVGDCNITQIDATLNDLANKGIPIMR